MVHLSLQELAGQGTAGTQQLALQDRIRAHVAAHLRDPGLSVESVAAALNCSKRHLHNAFADSQTSLGAFIQHSRLELCMRELLQPAHAQRTITEVAIDRKSTRLNSSHSQISYAVFCLKKKKKNTTNKQSEQRRHSHAVRT